MTYRDANANDLTDFLHLQAMRAGQPAFPELPALSPAGDAAARLACTRTGPGTIPPPGSIQPGRVQRLEIRSAKASRRIRGIVVELETNFGVMSGVEVELRRGRIVLARQRTRISSGRERWVILRVRAGLPSAGHYEIVASKSGRVLTQRPVIARRARAPPRLSG